MCVGNEPSLLSVWLQLLQGSVRLAKGWETSTRGGVGGGLGFFQPLHLQFSVWKKKRHIFLCNSENINSVFNKSYVVFALYFGISEIKCQYDAKKWWENLFCKGRQLYCLQIIYLAWWIYCQFLQLFRSRVIFNHRLLLCNTL